MILFSEDYAKYPTAIVDYKTTNKTFLRMAEVYRRMGIKNNVFHLTLLNPDLQGVDPFAKDLTQEQKMAIAVECRFNPWYALREVIRVPPVSGLEPVRLRANRGNLSLWWCFFSEVNFLLIQPRQTGKSVSTDCLMVCLLIFIVFSTRINMLTKDNKLRSANVDRLKMIRNLIPKYLWTTTREDTDNYHEVTYLTRNNRYTTAVAQSSEAGALNVGRGSTSAIAHVDEGPFIKFIRKTLAAMLAAGGAARDQARETGQPYGTIYTTTAGKIDDPDGAFFYNMMMGGATWTEKFFDCLNKEDLANVVGKAASGEQLLVNGIFSHTQLGYTDEWLRKTMAESQSHGQDADRDYFNRWTRGSLLSPLSIDLNNRIKESEETAHFTEITDEGYIVQWYMAEDQIEKYMAENVVVLGLDTSEAVGRDAIAMVGLNILDGSTLLTAEINETNLIIYSKFLANFLLRNPKTILVIEKKSTGQMIIDALILHLLSAGEDPFKRIYNKIFQDKQGRESDYRAIMGPVEQRPRDAYVEFKRDFGFNTTGDTRNLLYSRILQNAAKTSGHAVKDQRLSTQIRALVTRNGRIDHRSGQNDDMVIAWLLAHWFLHMGANLSEYGIMENTCLSLAGSSNKKVSQEELEERVKQKTLLDQIDQVVEKLSDPSTTSFSVAVLEQKLKVLNKQLATTTVKEVANTDALLRKAKEDRRKTKVKRITTANSKKSVIPNWW